MTGFPHESTPEQLGFELKWSGFSLASSGGSG